MTVSVTTTVQQYTGTGADTPLSTVFPFFVSSDIVVTQRVDATGVDTPMVLGVNYTVSGGSAAGAVGTVTPTNGAVDFTNLMSWTIRRSLPLTQGLDYVENDSFPAASHESGLDRLTLQSQDRSAVIDRSLRFPEADSTALISELPSAVARASKALTFDSGGNPVVTTPADASGTSVVSTGSTTARTLQERFSETRNVKDFGAIGDGSANDTGSVQAAIDAAEADGGGIVFFPAGTYLCNELTIQGAVRLIGVSRGGVVVSTGDSDSASVIEARQTDGSVSPHDRGAILTFASSIATKSLTGCGIENMTLRAPASNPTYAIVLHGVSYSHFENIHIDNFGGTSLGGILLEPKRALTLAEGGGGTQHGCFWNTFSGLQIDMAGSAAHGIILEGETEGQACTQNHFTRTTIVFGSGGGTADAVRFNGNTDNNLFDDLHTVRSPTNTGYGINFINGTTPNPNDASANYGVIAHPRLNTITKFNGHVNVGSECRGNYIEYNTSEGSSFATAPGAVTHYSVVDNAHRDKFETHVYPMSDELWIPATAFGSGTSAATEDGVHAAYIGCKVFEAPDLTRTTGTCVPGVYSWSDGKILSMRILWGAETAPATLTFADGDVSTVDGDITITAHGFSDLHGPVRLTTTGALPVGFSADVDYFVNKQAGLDTIRLSLTAGGADIVPSSAAGGGTHTLSGRQTWELRTKIKSAATGTSFASTDHNVTETVTPATNITGSSCIESHTVTLASGGTQTFAADPTAANPVVCGITGHGYATDDTVFITGSAMTEINDRFFRIAKIDADTFSLVGEDGAGRTTGAGGTAQVPVEYKRGDVIGVEIARFGAEAADTIIDEVRFLGVILVYKSDGATGGAGSTWDVPDIFDV
jgi:hypothetical protein